MKNYENYTVEDFVLDDEFRDWIQGSSHLESFWLSFVQNHPEKKQEIRKAEQLIRATAVAPERLSEKEVREEVHRFIEKALPAPTPDVVSFGSLASTKKRTWGTWAMAAMLVLALGAGWLLYQNQVGNDSPKLMALGLNSKLAETFNDSQKPLRLQLSDGSVVMLSPRSRLLYPAQFADSSRIVHLTGEAAFSVQRNSRPFMVYTGEMVTKVLGTRFVIRAYNQDKNYTVQVQSGKVSVYSAKPEPTTSNREINGLILTANQAAIFETEARQLTKTVVANPSRLKNAVESADFVYDEVPLPTVLHELEQHYGIAIQFDKQSFNACKITATLTNENLYEKLDLLCKTVSASYEIVDGQIVVSGKGCE
ncbi:FecR family protein [Telluribacter sp.]|jgi:ferric-dicitrate binding protein FerR (iron transport regulator)|uniref:FecR family protein n=1 Tax=Telluribacter sp. TaxID=1978767 RepID=UPI002E10676A|nr:FecR family protein [Telluribacter sp.]